MNVSRVLGHRAAIYIRVSTEEQVNGWSPGEQQRLGMERCQQEGWGCSADDVYVDAGFSGGRDDRPSLVRLLDVLDQYDLVVVWKLDRLTRRTETLTRILSTMDATGVRLVSLTEPVDGSTAMGRAMLEMMGVFAQLERSHAQERTRMGKRASAVSGRRNGGPRPFGYTQRDGALRLVPVEKDVLRRMRTEVLQGRPLRQIASDLNRDGVITAQGAKWSDTRISQLLRNSLYVGRVHYKGEEYTGQHDPVFTVEEWDDLQAVLAARRARPGNGRGRTPHVHLFSGGMLRCGYCGSSIVPRRTTNQQGRVYERYRCHGRMSGASPDCLMPSLARRDIDEAVLAYFQDVGLDLDETRRQIRESAERIIGATRTALAQAERQRCLAEDRLAHIRRDYQDGRLDAGDYAEMRDGLRHEREAACAEVKRLATRAQEVEGQASIIDAEQQLLERLAELRHAVAGRVTHSTTIEAMRAAIERVFDGFTIHAFCEPSQPVLLPEGWVRSRLYWHPALMPPGDIVIESHPRRDMILNVKKEDAFPQLRRVPLEARVELPVSAP